MHMYMPKPNPSIHHGQPKSYTMVTISGASKGITTELKAQASNHYIRTHILMPT